MRSNRRIATALLNSASLGVFVVVFLIFGLQSRQFLEPANLINILIQSSSTGIIAIGMTFVLLTAGVDLSVGAIMFVAAAVAGKMVMVGQPVGAALAVSLAIGIVFGAINALLVTRLKIVPFIVTLATLFMGRGLALWITETRAMNLPDEFLLLGSARWLGVIPMPILVFFIVLALAHLVLTQTGFGRRIYAVGNDPEIARKAGIRVGWILASVYLISGLCAAIGGMVALAQLGAVSPTFGWQKEFAAIAAAVLGGTSLFGGRGRVFPGTVMGAVLIQTVENGLVIVQADPYLYPMIISAIIFLAVLLDSARVGLLAAWGKRLIRVEQGESAG